MDEFFPTSFGTGFEFTPILKPLEPFKNSLVVVKFKVDSFIGVSAIPQPDGSQKAYAIHIFMDSQKGVVADRFGNAILTPSAGVAKR